MGPALALTLDRDDPRPLGTQLADQVRRLVVAGRLAPGTRLPSTRALAADLGVSRAVAEQAWDQLRAEGWLSARRGSGSWVAERPHLSLPGTAPRGPAPHTAAAPPPAAPDDLSRLIQMDAGTPWVDRRHDAAWRRAWREVAAARPPRGYDDPRGLPQLRAALAERLARVRGLRVDPDDVLLTSGTTTGLRQLLTALPPGPVAAEDPGYRAAVLTVRAAGREVLDLPPRLSSADAPVDRLAERLAERLAGAVAAYVTPAHQHPLGHLMPATHRLALLEAARRTDAVVVEDDYDSEFRYDVAPVPALASLDPETVAYLGTASKSVLPSLRLGWMVVPPALRERVDEHRRITHDVPAWPVQRAFWALLRDGYVDAVVRSARRVYAERAPRVVAALEPHAELAGPVAGMYSTWLLPHDRAVRAVADARAAGFRVNLLADYCRDSGLTGLVVGFGGPDDDQLDRALEVLARSLAR
ncbi:PLP-dependent aminotransferase family protein [Nocardioides solisilvae]|uniref:MocR-like pyridoxine biosynthesis transcription factor PdxR n=1 Tax=Nocardioides solisilvae TaxID=1542435 RepID=UPI000D7406D1|nr:PLP-dependent aminotransferase family protein [Nocardioides solisilvae]